MQQRILPLALLIWLGLLAGPVSAQEPLVEKVKKAIDKGKNYLFEHQRDNGGWFVQGQEAGGSCLATLALLEAGVALDDPRMKKSLDYVRSVNNHKTYDIALQTQVLAKAGLVVDKARINDNVKWLLDGRFFNGGDFAGWSYGLPPGVKPAGADPSNTQFGLLLLWAARDAGIKIDQQVWKDIRNHYCATQDQTDGTWTYSPGIASKMTMTTAGVNGLLLAGMELHEGREEFGKDGKVINCGSYKENKFVAKGMEWLEKNFQIEVPGGRTFYNLYGIERLGRLTGQRFLGEHDWYREGCEFLVKKQDADGSWSLGGGSDAWPVASTSFALLFLSKGRTPVLISKLVHGAWLRDPNDNDWNLDRHAIKNLTEHITKDLFTIRDKAGNIKPMPLAWQVFDLMKAVTARKVNNNKDLDALTAEMLQSPIIFLNGHKRPKLQEMEKELLKRYVENGGFIVAEACCGSKEFDKGFRELVKELWEHNDLKPLGPDHAIWRFPAEIKPGLFNLHGLEMGCKTVLVYSPDDMSCLWEANEPEGSGKLAFRTGVNIVAYATGMVPPLPRLTDINVTSKETDKNLAPPRFFLKAAQIYYRKDWTPPAPTAVSHLMSHLRKFAGMDVVLAPEKIAIDHEDLGNFKLIYFHDRAAFKFDDDRLKGLRFNLETGGLLLADACCGDKKFDQSFRAFAKQLFPDHPLQAVKEDDPLFGEKLNGKGNALTAENIKVRKEIGKPLVKMAPALEGIKIDGRWVVLYSKYDIGCALEHHQGNDCIGYDHDSALRIASAAVLYLMTP